MTGLTIIGIATSVAGLGVSMVSEWVNEKKMEEKIDKSVEEALKRREEEEP